MGGWRINCVLRTDGSAATTHISRPLSFLLSPGTNVFFGGHCVAFLIARQWERRLQQGWASPGNPPVLPVQRGASSLCSSVLTLSIYGWSGRAGGAPLEGGKADGEWRGPEGLAQACVFGKGYVCFPWGVARRGGGVSYTGTPVRRHGPLHPHLFSNHICASLRSQLHPRGMTARSQGESQPRTTRTVPLVREGEGDLQVQSSDQGSALVRSVP